MNLPRTAQPTPPTLKPPAAPTLALATIRDDATDEKFTEATQPALPPGRTPNGATPFISPPPQAPSAAATYEQETNATANVQTMRMAARKLNDEMRRSPASPLECRVSAISSAGPVFPKRSILHQIALHFPLERKDSFPSALVELRRHQVDD
jgi:hypothetical protein